MKWLNLKYLILTVSVLIIIIALPRISTFKHINTNDGRARADLHALLTALELYKMDNKIYPSPDTWIQNLIDSNLIQKKSSPDPWGNSYIYKIIENLPVVSTRGSDGKLNTNDDLVLKGKNIFKGSK